MRVFLYATGVDTGGQGERIADAFQRLTDWQVDPLATSRSPLGYPERNRLGVRDRMALAKRLYAEADVVHLRDSLEGWKKLDNGQCKPVVVHYHGTMFRDSPGARSQQARDIGALQVGSTLDLTMLGNGVEWLPSPYNLAELAAMKRPHDGPLRIAHFPTSAKVKSTNAFLAATQRLSERYPIDVLHNVTQGKVRHQPWSEVMAQKATADIYFDQVQLGYGNNAIEAWGMGIPVIAGVADPNVRALMLERFGRLPLVEATEDTIEHQLERLIQSPDMRQEYSAIGLEHVTRWHDDAKVVVQLKALYASAPPTRQVVLPRPSPGWLVRRQAERERRALRQRVMV